MGVRCNLGVVEGLETHWNERGGLGVAELNRALLLVRAAVQVQGMSNGTPSPTGLCSADWVPAAFLSVYTTCQIPASDTFKKYLKSLCWISKEHFPLKWVCKYQHLSHQTSWQSQGIKQFCLGQDQEKQDISPVTLLSFNTFQASITANAVTWHTATL